MESLFNTYPDVVNIKQVSEMLQIGTVLTYKLIKTGAIKGRKIGRDYKITKAAVIEFLFNNGG